MTALLVLYLMETMAQVKREREMRISASEVPATAIETVARIGKTEKVKWYKEFSSDSVTIEAKYRLLGQQISAEFTTSGELQDVEVLRERKELSEEKWRPMCQQIQADYEGRWRIVRVQQQYKGPVDDIARHLQEKALPPAALEVAYEIVVNGKTAEGWKKYEYTFSNSGTLLSRFVVVDSSLDNLEF